jgi:beta-lactam-binding protein with PASTA domain
VVRRGGKLLLDNGLCRTRQEVVYFAGRGPTKEANCLVNEVEVPDVRLLSQAEAEARVAAQPLTAKLLYKPAKPLQKPGIVVDQRPKTGYRSSYDRIILVVTKATEGVIPNVVGKTLAEAQVRLKRLQLKPRIRWTQGKPGRVLQQRPRPGVASKRGLSVELVVARPIPAAVAAG